MRIRLTRRRVRIAVSIGLGLVLLWALTSFAAAYFLTRRPAPQTAEPVPRVSWGTAEEQVLETSDGQRLGAWLFAGNDHIPAVVLLHGNGESRSHSLPCAQLLSEAGYTVLAITLRCHGDSTGDVNDFGRSAAADVVAAVDLLERRFPGKPVVVRGMSLGAAAAIFAAGRLGDRVAAYILECPFRDLRTAVRNRTRYYLPPIVEFIAYQGLVLMAPLVIDAPDGIAPIREIVAIPPRVPVLLLAGENDQRATPSEVSEFQSAIASHATMVVISGADHGKLYPAQAEQYSRVVLEFLRRLKNG